MSPCLRERSSWDGQLDTRRGLCVCLSCTQFGGWGEWGGFLEEGSWSGALRNREDLSGQRRRGVLSLGDF